MLKKLLFLLSGIFFFNLASGQTQPQTSVVGNETLEAQSEKLKTLADHVNLSYNIYINSATSTKTESARVKQEYEAALDAYLTELNSCFTLKSFATYQTELKSEIEKVNQQKTALIGGASR